MSKALSSILSIIIGFTVVAIILQIAGLYPLDFFGSLIKGMTGYDIFNGTFNSRNLGTFILTAVPIVLTGISVSFAFKTGMFNIGAEGQFIMGCAGAIFFGTVLDLPAIIFPIVIVLGSGLFGAVWGMIPGILKAWRNIHEVVICIMLNYIALYSANLYYKNVPGFENLKTPFLSENALLKSEFLSSLTGGSKLNWGILVAILGLIIYYVLVNKSVLGYRLKVIGFNKNAAHYSGINVKAGMVQSMAISGAFSGMAGAVLVLGTFYYGRELTGFENYGFDGLGVALVGGGSTLGILLAALLFSGLSVSAPHMQLLRIPVEVTSLVSGIIIFFISLSLVTDDKVENFRRKREEKKRQKSEVE